jgi:formate-dependent phosphoribosylglycinamide formyltransferase (GAR transformylase)
MKNLLLTVMMGVGATMMLSGCGKSAVACDDSDAKKLVAQIANDSLKSTVSLLVAYNNMNSEKKKTASDYLVTDIDAIRTESMDDKLEKTECAAQINVPNYKKFDITYKISKTSDGQLYAEVSGLQQ